jgi:hypothetical protein
MRITEALLVGGIAFGAIACGMEGAANLFEYGATQAAFVTRAAFEGAADQSREWRDITSIIATAEVIGAGILALVQRKAAKAVV